MTTGSRPGPSAAAIGNASVLPSGLDAAFHRAQDAAGASDTWLRVAGLPVRLRFAGRAMARHVTPPFAHLALDSRPPDGAALELRVWDDASTGVATPVPEAPAPARAPGQDRGAVYLYRDDGAEIAYEPGAGLLSALDRDARIGYLRAASADGLTLRERASPARTILAWWARRHGLQMAHAAAVGTPEGGVLLVGRSGSGKSTTALACLGSGLGYTADDCCLVSVADAPRVHALYATAKVARSRAAWFPRLEAEIRAAAPVMDDEALLRLADDPDALLAGFPLRAVLVPEVGAAEHSLERCSPAHGLGALAPSTMFQFPGSDAATLGRLADVARRVPCYRLRLGPDVPGVPRLIRDLLDRPTP